MQNEKKNKHMIQQDRIEIQECLAKGMSFKAIAKRIGKAPTTVSREIKQHAVIHKNGFVKTNEMCSLLLKAPFVCNSCAKRGHCKCVYPRRIYAAGSAHTEYRTVLKESREGIPLNKEEFYRTKRIISNAVRSGQHIFHALCANRLNVSKATVYRHINKGYYTIAPMDLPRAVKFKPRMKKDIVYVPKSIRIGRSFEDFLRYAENNPSVPIVEMDTLIGRQGGKVIMTLHFVHADFMFGLLLDNKSAAEAGIRIQAFKDTLAHLGFSFGTCFPILLTDNGGEFSHVSAFENDLFHRKETSVFFCDPNSPYQKPHVENNHTLFRCIVPGGSSFDDFTQETVNLIFSHINGVMRKQFNGKSAYDMFSFTYSQTLASAFGIFPVAPEAVIQTSLLQKTSMR